MCYRRRHHPTTAAAIYSVVACGCHTYVLSSYNTELLDGTSGLCCAWSPQDRRLFHSPTPNWSSVTRKVCFVGYGFRWIQPKDGMYVEPAMSKATCPILKQMLGYTSSNAGLYQPNSADTPIRPWLHSIGIDEPLGPAAKRPDFGALDGLMPLPRTVRELEAQGLFEGTTTLFSQTPPPSLQTRSIIRAHICPLHTRAYTFLPLLQRPLVVG